MTPLPKAKIQDVVFIFMRLSRKSTNEVIFVTRLDFRRRCDAGKRNTTKDTTLWLKVQ